MRLFPLVMMLALAGCATSDPQFGAVVQNNIVAQVVDLEPVYAGTAVEGSNGERSVEAIRRLNKGAVKPLYTGSTTKKIE
ncbi:MAG: hypothetical protein H7268_08900 [Sandarakinorhabdus sp.]|nr:hypothetical protein [Sandarakinorhabdus sp.]